MLLVLGISVSGASFVPQMQGEQPSNVQRKQNSPSCGALHSAYQLGPGDELELSALEVEDFTSKVVRIDGDGKAQIPLIGRMLLAGLTVPEAEHELNKRLSTYIRDPQISVNVKEWRSQPISVLGAVNTPGVHQLQGEKTLLEVLSLAGGLRPDAGYSVRISRRLEWGCIALPGATVDASHKFSVGEVSLKNILDGSSPSQNIEILPHDVVTVPKAEMIYVIGEVNRSGAFPLGEHETLSVLQAVSLAEGLGRTADAAHTRILRKDPVTNQLIETPVNVKAIISGKATDVSLEANEILFVPGSTGKKAALRALEAAIQTGTGIAIWRRP